MYIRYAFYFVTSLNIEAMSLSWLAFCILYCTLYVFGFKQKESLNAEYPAQMCRVYAGYGSKEFCLLCAFVYFVLQNHSLTG